MCSETESPIPETNIIEYPSKVQKNHHKTNNLTVHHCLQIKCFHCYLIVENERREEEPEGIPLWKFHISLFVLFASGHW